jgi:ankyrin repeat protein
MPETLCFIEAWEARREALLLHNEPSEAEYLSHILSHFQGIRHPADSRRPPPSFSYCPPYAKSIRHVALETEYQPLVDGAPLLRLFESFAAGDIEAASEHFAELEDNIDGSFLQSLLQPLATLATEKGHTTLLQFCLDKGTHFDKYLDEAVILGYHIGGIPMLSLLYTHNWKQIQTSSRSLAKLVNSEIHRLNEISEIDDEEDSTILTWLIDHGAKVSWKAVKEAAYLCRSSSTMRRLLSLNHGAAIAPGSLSNAASNGNIELVRLLLDSGASIDATIPESEMDIREPGPYSALYEAVRANHLEVARLLLERGAKIDRPYHKKKTPEQAAKGKKKMRELFETFEGTNRVEKRKRRL